MSALTDLRASLAERARQTPTEAILVRDTLDTASDTRLKPCAPGQECKLMSVFNEHILPAFTIELTTDQACDALARPRPRPVKTSFFGDRGRQARDFPAPKFIERVAAIHYLSALDICPTMLDEPQAPPLHGLSDITAKALATAHRRWSGYVLPIEPGYCFGVNQPVKRDR